MPGDPTVGWSAAQDETTRSSQINKCNRLVYRSAPTWNKSWTHRIPTDSGSFCNIRWAPPLAPDQTCSHGWTCHPWWISQATNVVFFSVKQTEQMTIKQGFFGESPQQITINFPVESNGQVNGWQSEGFEILEPIPGCRYGDTQGIPSKSQGYKYDKNECPSPQIWHFIYCKPLPTLVYRIIIIYRSINSFLHAVVPKFRRPFPSKRSKIMKPSETLVTSPCDQIWTIRNLFVTTRKSWTFSLDA